jgi:hypothetical protein
VPRSNDSRVLSIVDRPVERSGVSLKALCLLPKAYDLPRTLELSIEPLSMQRLDCRAVLKPAPGPWLSACCM